MRRDGRPGTGFRQTTVTPAVRANTGRGLPDESLSVMTVRMVENVGDVMEMAAEQTSSHPELSLEEIISFVREMYSQGPLLNRKLQHYRPYICPFEVLVGQVPPDARILDVGCGSGLFLGILARCRRIRTGVGFDVSPQAISLARRMVSQLPNPQCLRFERIDPSAQWPSGSFDVVSMIDVMHHIPPRQQHNVFEMAVAHLRPGGRLLYKDMAMAPAWRAWANRIHDLVLARQWIHYVPVETIVRWGNALGLSVIGAVTIDRLWYRHEMIVLDRVEQ